MPGERKISRRCSSVRTIVPLSTPFFDTISGIRSNGWLIGRQGPARTAAGCSAIAAAASGSVAARRKTRSLPSKLDIRAVAQHAQVSIATVSRTINGISTVGPELAKRVWKAIEELDYYPNTQARGLVSGKSRLFGLVISEITNPFFPELIQGFEDIAVENGYEISQCLKSRAIFCDYRPGAGIRLSPHFYNRDDELDSAIAAIGEIRQTGAWRTFATAKTVT